MWEVDCLIEPCPDCHEPNVIPRLSPWAFGVALGTGEAWLPYPMTCDLCGMVNRVPQPKDDQVVGGHLAHVSYPTDEQIADLFTG